jgi:hypothetical protein
LQLDIGLGVSIEASLHSLVITIINDAAAALITVRVLVDGDV